MEGTGKPVLVTENPPYGSGKGALGSVWAGVDILRPVFDLGTSDFEISVTKNVGDETPVVADDVVDLDNVDNVDDDDGDAIIAADGDVGNNKSEERKVGGQKGN